MSEGDFVRRSELGTEKHRSRFIAFILGPGRSAHDYTKSHARFVRGVMTQEVIAVTEDTPIEEIVALMEKHAIKRVPVMRGEAIVGMVSRSDLAAGARRREPKARGDDDRRGDQGAHPRRDRQGGMGAVEQRRRRGQGRGGRAHRHASSTRGSGQALKVVVENTPGVKKVHDRLVWIDPGSGLVVEAPEDDEDGDLSR